MTDKDFNENCTHEKEQIIECADCTSKCNCFYNFLNYRLEQLARKTQECEQIKEKYEALKLENQEGYEIVAELKHECEELKKEIINKNEKIKELRFSVSDLTNRLCYLNAEKSFRIVDLEQTLDEIEKELKERLVRTEEDLKYQCVDCMNVKSDRYRKALEEIEEIVNKKTETSICSECAYNHISECKDNCMQDVLENILDIINKAKGEG